MHRNKMPRQDSLYTDTKKEVLGIVVLATNSYFLLGVRFISRFQHYYQGDMSVQFHFFADTDPSPYLSDAIEVIYHPRSDDNWVTATNSKFERMLSLTEERLDYVYYFDADTNVTKSFTESWFLGELTGFLHYNNNVAKGPEDVPFDRKSSSSCYVPLDSPHRQLYYYGAAFGGETRAVHELMRLFISQQLENKQNGHEPPWNDESYLNCYFHNNLPAKIVPTTAFEFVVSEKGGFENLRPINMDWEAQKNKVRHNRGRLFDIVNMQVVLN